MKRRLVDYARQHRRDPTRSEWALWTDLCNKQMGYKFRRQQPIGPFIVDFVCFEKRLIVELDGWTHDQPQTWHRDVARQDWLEGQGFRVLRFNDDEVFEDRENVLWAIEATLEELP